MSPDAQNRLAAVLDRQIALATELASLLDTERAALSGTAADEVSRRAAEKLALLQSLEQLEAERAGLCQGMAALGAPSSDDLPGTSDAIRQRWHALLAVAKSCRDANEVNGYIINARHHQVRQLIDVLRGGAAVTYGPQGKTTTTALRALAQA